MIYVAGLYNELVEARFSLQHLDRLLVIGLKNGNDGVKVCIMYTSVSFCPAGIAIIQFSSTSCQSDQHYRDRCHGKE